VEDGRFGILPDDGPTVRLVGRAFDVLMALVEASGAVVSTDELSSRVRQGRIVDQDRQLGTIAALRKGFSANRELIPIVADGVTGSPARSARSPGTGGQVPAEAPADERAAQPRWTFFMAWAELMQNSKLVQPIQDLDTAVNVVTLGQMSEAV
jgi:hypothetical protein